MLFFLPLIALGALALLSGRRASTPSPGTSMRVVSGAVPSPLLVLDGFMRMGQTPPPQVILCAIAEAELMGRIDVANDLVRAFVLPVLEGAQRARSFASVAPSVHPGLHHPRRDQAYHPGYDQGASYDQAYQGQPRPQDPRQQYPSPASQDAEDVDDPEDEDEDDDQDEQDAWPIPAPAPAAPATPISPTPAVPMPGSPRSIARPEDVRVEVISRTPPSKASRNAGTITVSGRSSPIQGIGTEEWSSFISRVSREVPTFTTSRHVGQFRQRKDRLAELGIDPAKIVNSPDAQVAAFDEDMRDAHDHADRSGLIQEHLGTTVAVPWPQGPTEKTSAVTITLSGILGIIQAAGLEGAAQWLENLADRRRFPNTTQAFTRTNGVF